MSALRMVRFCCSFEEHNLLKLRTVEEAGARYSSAIVALVGEVQHGSRDLVEECEGDNLESRLVNPQNCSGCNSLRQTRCLFYVSTTR